MTTSAVRYSLLAPLFDLSFTEFLTLRIVRLLYIMTICALGLLAAFLTLVGFQRSFVTGLGALLLATAGFVLALTVIRIWLEATVVFFRIADNTAEVAEHGAQIVMNTAGATRSRETVPKT